ncbi:methylmalonyl Co-A mutase-associated GTPase MeaB [Nocardia sp. NPDC051832]|uniref:methylmalonyl Co-A mutase-associated GTPase MeaB n=1 Tax=Nocardia sp. NPDC051832 TaxID=3155673 RepID=UPI003444C063
MSDAGRGAGEGANHPRLGTTAGVALPGQVTPGVAAGVRRSIDVADLAERIRGGERAALARGITLVESTRADHRALAQQLLLRLTPEAANSEAGAVSNRVGITGVPGVGKSTFIDALGMRLIGQGHRVAVLAVDPSSTRTGGSILGDKTRMARLSLERDAYIRPSPTAGTLGGVAKATRETIVLLEAAGYDVILVETVGVGQSEVTVANMVDVFCFLTLARTGDQLQGIKKGVLELADLVAVNKADGKHELEAKSAARELTGALRLIHPHDALWRPPVLTMSGLEGVGLDKFWDTVLDHRRVLTDAGEFDEKRRRQQVDWTWTMVHDQLLRRLADNPNVKAIRAQVETQVRAGTLTAALAAEQLLDAFDS